MTCFLLFFVHNSSAPAPQEASAIHVVKVYLTVEQLQFFVILRRVELAVFKGQHAVIDTRRETHCA